ncbi:MAG: cupin domain-containing protein [Casimicrobiaceae bacterium]
MAAPAASRRLDASGVPLGALAPAAFLQRHWHKQPLLVRQAMSGFTGPFTLRELMALARRDDVESRLVVRHGTRFTLAHGPFRRADFKALPARSWTLLVQGVNLVEPAGDELLRQFSFLPFARLDDLMVSYAAPGGGVGPHVDSYDVFLLQGFGRRRWRFGAQSDHTLMPGRPLKILRHFTPTHDEVLAPGDMLYLPPHIAHDGVAIDACTTYSIGFRAPGATELAAAFLDFLRDELDLPGRYADPDLAPVPAPAAIGPDMRRRCLQLLKGIAWDRATSSRFLGCFLSEPKPHVYFEPPATRLSPAAFGKRVSKHGIHVDRRAGLLYDATHLFINGAALPWPANGAATLRRLANARALRPREARGMSPEAATILYNWYCDGYVHSGVA